MIYTQFHWVQRGLFTGKNPWQKTDISKAFDGCITEDFVLFHFEHLKRPIVGPHIFCHRINPLTKDWNFWKRGGCAIRIPCAFTFTLRCTQIYLFKMHWLTLFCFPFYDFVLHLYEVYMFMHLLIVVFVHWGFCANKKCVAVRCSVLQYVAVRCSVYGIVFQIPNTWRNVFSVGTKCSLHKDYQ